MAMASATATSSATSSLRPKDVWVSLEQDEKLEAAEAFLRDAKAKEAVLGPLSRKLNFRLQSLRRQNLEWLSGRLASSLLADDLIDHLVDVLKRLHFERRRDLMIAFLDAAQIPHDNANIRSAKLEAPSFQLLSKACEAICQVFPLQHVLTYLRTLVALEGAEGMWRNVPRLLQEVQDQTVEPALIDEPATKASDAPEEIPETSEEFTTLDNLLIQTIVNTALKIEGAPSREQLDDLTDELLSLNGHRKRSFFHRGFYDAIFSEEISANREGENSESRLWYVAGAIMGWARQHKSKWIVDFFSAHPEILDEVVTDQNPLRMRMVLPVLYPVCLEHGLHPSCVRLLNGGLAYLQGAKQLRFRQQVLSDSSAFLRDGDAATAMSYLETLPEPALEDENLPYVLSSFGRRLIRKKAQCLQLLGQMESAENRLKQLAALGDFEESIEALTDLGLIVGGFESLYSILPDRDRDLYTTKIRALERGRTMFEDALRRAVGPQEVRGRNAHFALGILELFRETAQPAKAARHLSLALVGMLQDEEAYRAGSLIDWTKLLAGMAVLETCDESRVATASSNIRQALRSEAAWPAWLLVECLEAVALHEDGVLLAGITEALLKVDETGAFPKLRSTDALKKIPTLLAKYARWVDEAKLSVQEIETEWSYVLKTSLDLRNLSLAEEALEALEALAHDWTDFTDRFLSLLGDATNYSPAWTPFDANEASIRLLESRGRFDEAARILEQRFWTARVERTPQAKADCEAILAALEEMGRSGTDLAAMRSSLPDFSESATEQDKDYDLAKQKLKEGARVCILFVGGNETQAQYDEQVRRDIEKNYSGVVVEFEHPGWGSNWAPVCDLIERRLGTYDGVVLSHLVRTNMGRRLRKMCGESPPWFACRGKGASSIQRSIIEAAIRCYELRTQNPQV
jgi:hypothetical protein